MVLLLVATLILIVLYRSDLRDTFRRFSGRILIEAPGGCVTVPITKETSFSDDDGGENGEFSIYKGFGAGPIAWSFFSHVGEKPDSKFSFSVTAVLDAARARQIEGAGCHVLEDRGAIKRVARRVPGEPEVSFDKCTMIQHRFDPTYFSFDGAGEATARVTCTRDGPSYCSGDVETDDAVFRIAMLKNSIDQLPKIAAKVGDLVQQNMTIRNRCFLW